MYSFILYSTILYVLFEIYKPIRKKIPVQSNPAHNTHLTSSLPEDAKHVPSNTPSAKTLLRISRIFMSEEAWCEQTRNDLLSESYKQLIERQNYNEQEAEIEMNKLRAHYTTSYCRKFLAISFTVLHKIFSEHNYQLMIQYYPPLYVLLILNADSSQHRSYPIKNLVILKDILGKQYYKWKLQMYDQVNILRYQDNKCILQPRDVSIDEKLHQESATKLLFVENILMHTVQGPGSFFHGHLITRMHKYKLIKYHNKQITLDFRLIPIKRLMKSIKLSSIDRHNQIHFVLSQYPTNPMIFLIHILPTLIYHTCYRNIHEILGILNLPRSDSNPIFTVQILLDSKSFSQNEDINNKFKQKYLEKKESLETNIKMYQEIVSIAQDTIDNQETLETLYKQYKDNFPSDIRLQINALELVTNRSTTQEINDLNNQQPLSFEAFAVARKDQAQLRITTSNIEIKKLQTQLERLKPSSSISEELLQALEKEDFTDMLQIQIDIQEQQE